MKILDVVQGTPEWEAVRLQHGRTASMAPAMMGAALTKSRADLVREVATGNGGEISDYVRDVIFERGHHVEAAARAIADEIVGSELYPVTAVSDDGTLLASFDGMTMGGDIAWECKQWNERKADDVLKGHVPLDDEWQVVQQLVVGASRVLYMVTDGTPERTVYCWRELRDGEADRLRRGWEQFEQDVANYQHVDEQVAPAGRAPESLPALFIEVSGAVTASNLAEYKAAALALIGSVNTDLQTDQDFADADKAVKWCADVETRLEAAKQHALSQTATIDELFRALDEVKAEARSKRLELEKLVKARKESIRAEIVASAYSAAADHVAKLNARLGGAYMPLMPHDFALAVKGKKSVKSMRDAVDTDIARFKIDTSEIADRIEANIKSVGEFGHLFPDLSHVCAKTVADFSALLELRKLQHKAKEDAEREKMRQEEQRRADARIAAEIAEAEAIAKSKADAIAREAREDERRKLAAEQAQAQVKAPETAKVVPMSKQPQQKKLPDVWEMVALVARHYGLSMTEAAAIMQDADYRVIYAGEKNV